MMKPGDSRKGAGVAAAVSSFIIQYFVWLALFGTILATAFFITADISAFRYMGF